ncbi:MAG: hypothetical protein II166_02935, partial [Firmicutes bacterium]|nr:hypothetical protein [Bacillota bacterium]
MRAIDKDLIREIKNSRSRFLSILILIALAVAFLSGLRATAPDMKNTLDDYMDRSRFMDIQVLSTLGLTDEDVEYLAYFPGIAAAEGSRQLDVFAKSGDNEGVVKLWSLPKEINAIEVRRGRMPESASECLADKKLLDARGLKIGDSLGLEPAEGDEDLLRGRSFTIVGEAVSPYYISVERGSASIGIGEVAAFVYLPEDAFDMDYYAAAYLLADGAGELRAFSDEYDDLIGALTDRLDEVKDSRASQRLASVRGEASEKIADARKELDEAKADADKELEDARIELADARKELDDGYAELEDARATLKKETADAEKKIADGEKELADAAVELADAEKELADAGQELIDGKKELDDAAVELADGKKELEDGEKEYADGLAEFNDGVREYEDGLKKYQDGLKEYEDGKKELRDARKQLKEGRSELDSARSQLRAGEEELEQGRAALDQFTDRYIVPGFAQAGMPSVSSASDVSEGLLAEGAAGGPFHMVTDGVISGILSGAGELAEALASLETLESQKAQILQGQAQAQQAGTTAAAIELNARLMQVEAAIAMIEGGLARQGLDPQSARYALAAMEEQAAAMPKSAAELRQNYQALKDAEDQLGAGWAAYYDGVDEYHDGLQALEDGEKELADAEKELADAAKELEDAKKEIDYGRAELEDARKELDDGWAEYYDGVREYEDGLKEYEDGVREYEDGLKEYEDGKKEYEDGLIELEDAKKTLKRETADAERKIADAEKELADGEKEYADGWQEYLDGKAEAEEKIADAEAELADAQEELDKIISCKWYVLDRSSNPGYLSFGQDADRMANLAKVFPMLFFLVAMLVCLTTMTRMVEADRVQIGSLKALGYSSLSISRKYLLYGAVPAVTGSLLGLLIGYTLFPTMIFTAWQIMYEVPRLNLAGYVSISLFSVGAALLCTVGATLWACVSTLGAVPAQLMRPKAPKAGKRIFLEYITPLWKRMGFFRKLTARNLLRYRKRFWMTILGIGGCTALIIAGFGLRTSLTVTMDRQYEDIFLYEAQLTVDSEASPEDRRAIESFLEGSKDVKDFMACRMESDTFETDRYSIGGYLEVCESEKLPGFVDAHEFGTGEPLALTDDGVIIGTKLSELLGAGPGDYITVDSGDRVRVRVSGVMEHYLAHFVYITPAYYEEVFGKAFEPNAYQVDLVSSDMDVCSSFFEEYLDLKGTASAQRMEGVRDTYQHSMERVDFVVVIVILSAAALAIVVLHNLSSINITERRRELATIKVLGFYDSEVSAYIYRENVVLTILGIILGIGLGRALHSWLVRSVEIDIMMFGRDTDP